MGSAYFNLESFMLKRVRIKICSYIDNLDSASLPEGEREVSESEHVGAMKISCGETSLSYRESTEGGSVFSDILMHESGAVTVVRTGAINSTMHFDENEEFNTVYSLPPYKFDMNVRTKKIRSTLTESGGTIDIFYEMTLGGADKRVKMKIEVSEE